MRKNIMIMNLLVAFFWMTMYSYVPNLPVYSQSLGADAVALGVVGGVYGVAQIILRIPIGVTSDRTGKNKLMLIIGCQTNLRQTCRNCFPHLLLSRLDIDFCRFYSSVILKRIFLCFRDR